MFERGTVKLVSRGPAMRDNPNTENGLAALRAVELKEDDPALAFLRRLQGYVIYSPTTPVLRGVAPETQPRQPLGLSGGRLPDAVHELLMLGRGENGPAKKVLRDVLELIDWAKSYGSASSADLPLSQAACRFRPETVPLFRSSRDHLGGCGTIHLSARGDRPTSPPAPRAKFMALGP